MKDSAAVVIASTASQRWLIRSPMRRIPEESICHSERRHSFGPGEGKQSRYVCCLFKGSSRAETSKVSHVLFFTLVLFRYDEREKDEGMCTYSTACDLQNVFVRLRFVLLQRCNASSKKKLCIKHYMRIYYITTWTDPFNLKLYTYLSYSVLQFTCNNGRVDGGWLYSLKKTVNISLGGK